MADAPAREHLDSRQFQPRDQGGVRALPDHLPRASHQKFPQREGFKIGGIVGSAEIVDCVTACRSYWFGGEYGFVLKNARRTPFRPMKGNLGFFNGGPKSGRRTNSP
jgi:hypothetical protein